MTSARILDHHRLCGSEDVFLIETAFTWCVVRGIELAGADALEMCFHANDATEVTVFHDARLAQIYFDDLREA